MKILLMFIAVLCITSPMLFAQGTSQLDGTYGWTAERGRLYKTHTTFTATSDDTTGYVTINVAGFGADPLLAREVDLILVATDSVSADVYVIARNSFLTSVTSTYSDSIIGTSNTSNIKVITLKGTTLDRFSSTGVTQFKVGTVFRASGQGTTAGRTLKQYIKYIR